LGELLGHLKFLEEFGRRGSEEFGDDGFEFGLGVVWALANFEMEEEHFVSSGVGIGEGFFLTVDPSESGNCDQFAAVELMVDSGRDSVDLGARAAEDFLYGLEESDMGVCPEGGDPLVVVAFTPAELWGDCEEEVEGVAFVERGLEEFEVVGEVEEEAVDAVVELAHEVAEEGIVALVFQRREGEVFSLGSWREDVEEICLENLDFVSAVFGEGLEKREGVAERLFVGFEAGDLSDFCGGGDVTKNRAWVFEMGSSESEVVEVCALELGEGVGDVVSDFLFVLAVFAAEPITVVEAEVCGEGVCHGIF
jgi:hypothetical protein